MTMAPELRKKLSLAILLALTAEIALFLLAWKATPVVSDAAHRLAFAGVDLSHASAPQIASRENLQGAIYCVLSALYLMAGFIVILPLLPWASVRWRLAVGAAFALLAIGIGLWRASTGTEKGQLRSPAQSARSRPVQ